MNVVIVGATGMIGSAITGAMVQAGHGVIALCRDPIVGAATLPAGVACVPMNDEDDHSWRLVIAEVDAVINLAGEPIGGARWNASVKDRLLSSRIDTTHRIVEEIVSARNSGSLPAALINASAVGYYGDCANELVTESRSAGAGFLANLCRMWEEEAMRARDAGVRVALMRIGLVLAKSGVLHKMLYPFPVRVSPFKLGLGGRLGSGMQWMPWVHIDDVVGLFMLAAANTAADGPINVTAPNPVTNAEFTRELGRALRRPAILPIPEFALRLMVGEFAQALVTGQRAVPAAANKLGYQFEYRVLTEALAELL